MAAVTATSNAVVLGVDVGGTKVAAGRVREANVESRVEHPTDLSSAEALLDGIERAVSEVVGRAGTPTAVGVGLPSQIDFDSGTVVSSANIPLHGVAVREELERRLDCPVFVDNDANCAALAEAQVAGVGSPVQHLVMLTLGTGVGGGVVIDGRIFRGARGLGAELGHVVVQEDGPQCPGSCPNRGCLEALCSGTALEREGLACARANPDSALGKALAAGDKPAGHDIVKAARAGDAGARDLLVQLGRHLGVGMANMINVFEPELVVVGGGLSRAHDLFMDAAREEARHRALPALFEGVTIAVARAGADAGVVGAGTLAAHELERAA